MVLDTLFRQRPAKAATGIGTLMWDNAVPLDSVIRDPRKRMKQAQTISHENRWIRACERVITDRFSTVPWHLEDADDERIGEESAPNLKAVVGLLEKPYTPVKGDPLNATPRTRAGLWKLTARHMGVCGVSAWFLDQTEALSGTPLQLLYINPARLTPSIDDNGDLRGWVLDADARGGGMPLEREQVLLFPLEPPDTGFFPVGLVESAMSLVTIGRHADRHASGVLGSGGRLPGVFSPKEGTIPPDQFAQMTRDLRNIVELPDAARRSLVLSGPIDFTRTSATPQELDLIAVAGMGRDDICELWGVPRSQLGGSVGGGLNSGETKAYDEAVLWQNAVGPRLRSFWEVLQFQLLDRYKEAGIEVELVVEEPEFDDETPMFQRAQMATDQPLTVDQRLELLGLDPVGGDLGRTIFLPISLVSVGMGPDGEGGEGVLASEPLPVPAKALLDPVRRSTVTRLQKDVQRVLDAMRRDVAARVTQKHGHLSRKPTDDDAWWSQGRWQDELTKALRPHLALAAETASAKVASRMGKAAKADDGLSKRVLARLLGAVGTRITGILDTTREMIRGEVEKGIAEGLSPAELGDRIEAASAFGEYRAELVARSETAVVLNNAAAESYREYGVTHVEILDGDQDEECAEANGQRWTLDEFIANPIGHPNCVRDAAPVLGGT